MPESLKKRPKLSVKMQLFKDNIHALTRERKSLIERVYEGGKFASVVIAGINKVFSVFASFLSSFSAIPLIGNFFHGLAAIPEGIVFFSDPKKTIKEKLISAVAIIIVGGIALTAFILGTIPTLIFSTAVASFFALLEGLNVANRYFQKQKTTELYNERNEFVNLVTSRKIPEGDKFNELLEIRAVELEHDIDRPGVRKSIQRGMQAELEFINDELNKRNIKIGCNPENKASQLAQLYKIHKEQIQVLTGV
ncbi:T4SS effector SidA family protein, partial [uncultured Legionella sp.]|uniref:T4SS effector SidA family protein n=1 Tax=uncultured Legionella sp. TaxID=210934 RepID=UPI002626E220